MGELETIFAGNQATHRVHGFLDWLDLSENLPAWLHI